MFEPLADVGELAFIRVKKRAVRDDSEDSKRTEVDEVTAVAYHDGWSVSLGGIGATRDVVVEQLEVLLTKIPAP